VRPILPSLEDVFIRAITEAEAGDPVLSAGGGA
jgi:hypothetical protein